MVYLGCLEGDRLERDNLHRVGEPQEIGRCPHQAKVGPASVFGVCGCSKGQLQGVNVQDRRRRFRGREASSADEQAASAKEEVCFEVDGGESR